MVLLVAHGLVAVDVVVVEASLRLEHKHNLSTCVKFSRGETGACSQ